MKSLVLKGQLGSLFYHESLNWAAMGRMGLLQTLALTD